MISSFIREGIIKLSVDLHVHVGPEIIPRKFNLSQLINYERGKIKGIAAKNHFFPVINDFFQEGTPLIINSVTLNNYVGGFNPDIIRSVAELSELPIIVWFPTISSRNFIVTSEWEIPPEWIDEKMRSKIKFRKSNEIQGLFIFDEKKELKSIVVDVLRVIKENDAVLATGHISWQESECLVNYALNEIGIKKVIITHPIYQKIEMPVNVQKKLADRGALIEQCYSMHTIDKISMRNIAEQIKIIGPERCILSSDVGQIFSKSPSEALNDFIVGLEKEGLKEEEFYIMLVENTNKIVGSKTSI